MNFFKNHVRAILIATAFAVIVGVISFFIYVSIKHWTSEIVETNSTLTELVAKDLVESSKEIFTNITNYKKATQTQENVDDITSILADISSNILKDVRGMEGGYYHLGLDDFIGYSFPTSPPPKPVYGPPPRSYNIIKFQVLETIKSGKSIVKLHQFDPAIFPLSTQPIFINDELVGVAWTRIHIERELPKLKLRQVINIGAIISLLGFAAAVVVSISQRKKILKMHNDLEIVKSGISHEVTIYGGRLGYIGRSINKMVNALKKEHNRREILEKELHRREKMASLGKLIAGVAHEVKTPLAIIKTRVQMLQRELEDSVQYTNSDDSAMINESLELVLKEINRLSGLVRRLLFFTKPMSMKLRKTNINELLEYVFSLLKKDCQDKKINCTTELSNEIPDIHFDSNSLEQVFINILTNSIESISDNGKIHIQTSLNNKNNKVIIDITDNGKGIPNTNLQKIFEPFFTTKDNGFGLGLSISRDIIEAHHGTIRFHHNKPKGTKCEITFPIKKTAR